MSKFCYKCGTTNPIQAIYCIKCGKEITKNSNCENNDIEEQNIYNDYSNFIKKEKDIIDDESKNEISKKESTLTKQRVHNKGCTIILLVVIGLFAGLILFAMIANQNYKKRMDIEKANATYSITYKVYGTPLSAKVEFSNETGGIDNAGEVLLPWEKSITVKNGTLLSIGADQLYNNASVTCEIWVDGVLWKNQTSNEYARVAGFSGN